MPKRHSMFVYSLNYWKEAESLKIHKEGKVQDFVKEPSKLTTTNTMLSLFVLKPANLFYILYRYINLSWGYMLWTVQNSTWKLVILGNPTVLLTGVLLCLFLLPAQVVFIIHFVSRMCVCVCIVGGKSYTKMIHRVILAYHIYILYQCELIKR